MFSSLTRRRVTTALALACLAPLGAIVPGCGDDPKPATDTVSADVLNDVTAQDVTAGDVAGADIGPDVVVPPVEPDAIFLSGMQPSQHILDGAFPNDTLWGDDGALAMAPLASNPRFASLAASLQLDRFDALLKTREGFSFSSASFFPMAAAPDLETFADRVTYVGLEGPDAGVRFPAQFDFFAKADILVVLPAWGYAMVPGSTYAIIIEEGVKDVDGRTIVAPPAVLNALAFAAPAAPTTDGARARGNASWTMLREALALTDDRVVMATVFTTDRTIPWLSALFDAADAFALQAPTSHVGSASATELTWVDGKDIFGSALDDYFGQPTGTFAYMPSQWNADARLDAEGLASESGPYAGGTYHGRVARVVQGGLVMPSFNQATTAGRPVPSGHKYVDGAPVPHSSALIPFSVYFCADHMANPTTGAMRDDIEIPVAIFTHGGTETRGQAMPFAVTNCLRNIATVVLDLPFHGGRQTEAFFSAEALVVPVPKDIFNSYNGKAESDGVGDPGGATVSVGSLFGLGSRFDPDVIEANLSSIAIETHVLIRYLKDTGANGLGAFVGATFATDRLLMESLSFGTSFTPGVWALDPSVSHVVMSVGSAYVLSVNLPMAPSNAGLVTGIVDGTLGLANDGPYLAEGAWRDPIMSLLQWFSQRADPLAYAPFVLRFREDGHTPKVLLTGNSWDETLFGPAQTTLNQAFGVPAYADATSGWTLDPAMPGASTIEASVFPAEALSNNVTYGDRTTTAALFYDSRSCHPHITTPVCVTRYESDYPPAVARSTPVTFLSPICEIHDLVSALSASFVDPETAASIPAPRGTSCADLFAPR